MTQNYQREKKREKLKMKSKVNAQIYITFFIIIWLTLLNVILVINVCDEKSQPYYDF